MLSSNPFKVSGIHLLLQMCFILNILTRFSFISSLSYHVQCYAFYCSVPSSAVLCNVVHFFSSPAFGSKLSTKNE